MRTISVKQRIDSIDNIRGFAILGIFFVNMIAFHSPILYVDPFVWWGEGLDLITYIVIDVFAQASFYPLFSLLFGFSFVWLRDNAINKGLSFPKMAIRRLLFLLAVGIIHAIFIWHGDILFQYAILGFFLLFFLHLPGRTLLVSGLFLYGIPTVGLIFLLAIAPTSGMEIYDQQVAERSIAIYQQGSFFQITEQRVSDWLLINHITNFPFVFISIFPLFLMGAAIAKLKWLEKPKFHQIHTYLILITSCVGLLIKLSPYLFSNEPVTQYLQDSIGGLSLAIAYGLIIITCSDQKWLQPLAVVGRMSISNYLLQSVVSTFLFYQYGFGMYGEMSVHMGTALVIIIFITQIVLSQYWLNRFHYGPVEWLWRCVTYIKLFKNKKQKQYSQI